MQTDLDDYFVIYNTKRPHQGRNMKGMTPYAVFKKGSPYREPAGLVSGECVLCTC